MTYPDKKISRFQVTQLGVLRDSLTGSRCHPTTLSLGIH